MDLSKYKIIFIHGLASKPPEENLLANWKRCLIENIRCYDSDLADEMKDKADDLFHMAYWANVIPNHIEDDPRSSKYSTEKIIELRRRMGDKFHVSNKIAKFNNFWKRIGIDTVDLVLNILTVKDEVVKKKCFEVELYQRDNYLAERIRLKLESPLRKALLEGRKVAIVAHSMGTFIAYDVLWRFSHHRDAADMWDKKVELFITMGSPLGDPLIKELMLGKRYGFKEERGLPKNITYWVNFSALGDIVCHDQTLTDDFKYMKKLNLLKDFRDYRGLYNPYRNKEGKLNPHKSYGYLLQPKLAKTIFRFFGKIKWR